MGHYIGPPTVCQACATYLVAEPASEGARVLGAPIATMRPSRGRKGCTVLRVHRAVAPDLGGPPRAKGSVSSTGLASDLLRPWAPAPVPEASDEVA